MPWTDNPQSFRYRLFRLNVRLGQLFEGKTRREEREMRARINNELNPPYTSPMEGLVAAVLAKHGREG